MSTRIFIHLLIVAVISLAVTFVVFEYLDSYAEGKGELLGGTILYGGALAGYVVIFGILFAAYTKIGNKGEQTNININGQWSLCQVKHNGDERRGIARIYQTKGNTRLEVAGEVESKMTPPSVTFNSLVAVLKGRRFVFLYENNRREMGIALGDIVDNHPNHFTVTYYDVLKSDYNQDPEGQITFSKKTTGEYRKG